MSNPADTARLAAFPNEIINSSISEIVSARGVGYFPPKEIALGATHSHPPS